MSYRSRIRPGMMAALGAVALLSSGCASGRPYRTTTTQSQMYRVVVENDNWLDMNVYAQTDGGARLRLGSVSTGQTKSFDVRASRIGVGSFRLLGDPIGSTQIVETQWMTMGIDGLAVWKIGTHPSTSYAMTR
jgi:hypothetical protein